MALTDEEQLLILKMQLLREWGNSGGWTTLRDVQLVEDLMQVREIPDGSGRVDPRTLTPRVRALANAEYGSQLIPPLLHPEHEVV